MSTTQSSVLQPAGQSVAPAIDPSISISSSTTKSTVAAPQSRSADEIKKEIAATEATLNGARKEYGEAVQMASPENRSKMLLLGTMAGLQEQADQAKEDSNYDKIVNGENPDGSAPVLNPLRLLSVDLAKKVIGALDTIKRVPKQINSLEQRLSNLNGELNAPPSSATASSR
jgi:hypothetical protein